jgi:hypothetical protein
MESSGWFESLKDKMSNMYKKAKDAVTPSSAPSSAPLTSGGSKRKNKRKSKSRSKRTKKVRFSKRHKVYRYKTMRRYMRK